MTLAAIALVIFNFSVGAEVAPAQCVDYRDAVHWAAGIRVGGNIFEANCFDPVAVGDRVYVIDFFHGLHVIDFRDPLQPVRLRTIPGGASSYSIVAHDNLLYVVGPRGLVVFDITDPDQPATIGTFPDAGGMEIRIDGGFAYIAAYERGLLVVDLVDPRAPRIVGRAPVGGIAMGLAIRDGLAYVGIRDLGLAVIDVHDPVQPVVLGSVDFGDDCRGVALSGDFAFVADTASRVWSVDVSDPWEPLVADDIIVSSYAGEIAVHGSLVLAATSDLEVIDAGDPRNLVRRGLHMTPGGSSGFCLDGDRLILADGPYLGVYDLGGDKVLQETTYYGLPGSSAAYDLAVVGDQAFIAGGAAGLVTVDVVDPAHPADGRSVLALGNCVRLEASGSTLYVARASGSIATIDCVDPRTPRLVGETAVAGPVTDLEACGPWLAVACDSNGIELLRTDAARSETGHRRIATAGRATNVAMDGDLMCVSLGSAGLQVCDLQLIAQPFPATVLALPAPASDLVLSGEIAYVSDLDHGLHVIDLADRRAPKRLCSLSLPYGGYKQMMLVEGLLYVGVRSAGVLAYSLADPRHPLLLGLVNARFSYAFEALAHRGGYLLAAGFQMGLCVLPAHCAGPRWLSPDVAGTQADVVEELRVWAAPNPFNPLTVLHYDLAQPVSVELAVYDLSGRLVRRMASGYQEAGPHAVAWDGMDQAGVPVASGVYLARLQAGDVTACGRVMLVR